MIIICSNQARKREQHITRAQARKAIFAAISPALRKLGFEYQKQSNLWRVGPEQTDVIEFRFMTVTEHVITGFPESAFSVLYGCYFDFVPSPFAPNLTHRIEGLITPDEVHCHIRGELARNLIQVRVKTSARGARRQCFPLGR